MEISQKTAEEEERFRKEMAKYAANLVFINFQFNIVLAWFWDLCVCYPVQD